MSPPPSAYLLGLAREIFGLVPLADTLQPMIAHGYDDERAPADHAFDSDRGLCGSVHHGGVEHG